MYQNISQSLNTFADRTYNFTADLQHLTADIIDNTRHQIASVDVNQILTETDALSNEIPSLLTNITNTAASTMMANISRSSTASYTDTSPYPDVAQRLEHAPQLTASALVKVYVLMAMAVVSLTGNVATMWNIYKTRIARRSSRHTWSAIYTLIFHLSIADLIVTGFCIVGDAAWYYTVQWLAGEQSCKLVKLFQMFGLYLSTYVLVLIGVDRWIAVKYPMKSLNMAKRCYRLLGGIYVLSLVLSMPQYFIFRVRKGPFIEDFYQCVTHGFYEYDWQEQLYTTFTMVFMFLLPLAILFGTYLSTFRTISDSEQMFQGSKLAIYSNKPSMQTNRQRLIHKAKMKSLRISVVIIFAFLVCWTPYNVMMIIFIFLNPDKSFSEDLQKGIFFFGMANSLVNPLIYGAFHLCPTKRKAAKAGSNNKYSLTRGDSQRSPSMLTAVTLVDCNQRSSRILRQASYLRTYSNGSQKEHIGLLQNPTARNAVRKSASLRSQAAPHKHPHPLWKQQQSLQERATTHWSGSPADSFCVMSSSNGGTIAVPSDRSVIDEQRSAKINSLNGFISSKEQISHV